MPVPQDLIHRVEIQFKAGQVADSSGEYEDDWQTLIVDGIMLNNVPAKVLTGPGRYGEILQADQVVGDIAARITLRWFPGLLAQHRILWDGHIFGIMGIPQTDPSARREWRVVCQERQANEG